MASGRENDDRLFVVLGIVGVVTFVFLVRLFFLQVIDDTYKLSAENNVLRHIKIYPARGLIYDRNGELLVFNQAAYDLMVIPRQLKNLDTTALCEILQIDKTVFSERMAKAKRYSYRKASTFDKQIPAEVSALLQEKMYRFNGFFVQKRTLRKYPRKIGAHLLGYVAEVNNGELDKDNYYRQGDHIGKGGIELAYEKELRGIKGTEIVMVDVFNRTKGKFKDGKYDTLAVTGANITSTIDADLQAFAEELMTNKLGGIVAIEPSTGEILALVSAPTYDPELLVGKNRSINYPILLKDPNMPLFNRALLSEQNPPGSTFKLINALIGQQVGVTTTSTSYSCPRGYIVGNFRVSRSP
jgi:penicillin-binding protein 2